MDKRIPEQPAQDRPEMADAALRFEPRARLSGRPGMIKLFEHISQGERA
jgi:hypothetical protein